MLRALLPLLMPLLAAGETGSAACEPCHRAIYRAYSRTPMAMSSGRVGSGAFQEKFDKAEFSHQRSGVRYRVYSEGRGYFFDFDKAAPEATIHGSRPLEFFIGSGAVGRSYFSAVDGFLYQAPVSYYSGLGTWGLSPGFQHYDRLHLTRAVEPACLQCHASRLQPWQGTQNGFAAQPFLEGGVSCERCHGAGESHIATGDPGAIVNPAKLDPGRRDSVCAQCHLSGEASVVKKKSFRPGELFSDYVTVFVRSGGRAGMKVTSHFEKLSQSACKRASGDRLWCGGCHDPHGVAVDFRKKCLDCHALAACKARPAARRQRADNCIGCHMPRSPVTDVEHAVYTDHSIPKRPRAVVPSPDLTLVPFGGGTASPRDLALAYASLGDARALKLLLRVRAQAPDDVEVLLQLAYLSSDEEAVPLYERVLRADPSQVVAAVNLGSALIKRGDSARAVKLWKDVLARSPGLEAASVNLASAQFRTGDSAAAEATLVRALGLNPDNAVARKLLGEVRRGR